MVVEYMLNIDENGRLFTPGYIKNGGQAYNEVDETYIGWVEDKRTYYIPDSLKILSKADFVDRYLGVHAANPIHKREKDATVPGGSRITDQIMTNEEAASVAEEWYDNFVVINSK